MGTGLAVAGSFLFKIGKGIANAIKRRREEKRQSAKMQKVLGLIEGETKRWDEYIKGLNEVYSALGEKTKRDINKVFNDQRKQLKNAIQQRRIPEYLSGIQKLSKVQAEAISDAMLGIEQARFGAEGQALQTAFQQKMGLAGLSSALQDVYRPQAKGSVGGAIQSALAPFTDFIEKESGTTINKWLAGESAKRPEDEITDIMGGGQEAGTTLPRI